MARIEVVVSRDPDSSNELTVYLDGEPVDADIYQIDAGAGYEWGDWIENRAGAILHASPKAAAEIFELAADPPGGEYLDGKPSDIERCRQELALTVNSIREASRIRE